MPEIDFTGALRALRDGGVLFVVVGGVAAVLQGAPMGTFDLDIVPARDEENLARLARVVDAGWNALHVLALDYEDLAARSVEMEVAPGLMAPVLHLAAIIALKEHRRSDLDAAMLPVLRRTLEEKRKAHQV